MHTPIKRNMNARNFVTERLDILFMVESVFGLMTQNCTS
jgi:hypothetical protein